MNDTRTLRTTLIVAAAVIAAIVILALMTDNDARGRTSNLSTYTTGGTVLPEEHSDYSYPQGAAQSAQLEQFQQALAFARGMALGRQAHNAVAD